MCQPDNCHAGSTVNQVNLAWLYVGGENVTIFERDGLWNL